MSHLGLSYKRKVILECTMSCRVGTDVTDDGIRMLCENQHQQLVSNIFSIHNKAFTCFYHLNPRIHIHSYSDIDYSIFYFSQVLRCPNSLMMTVLLELPNRHITHYIFTRYRQQMLKVFFRMFVKHIPTKKHNCYYYFFYYIFIHLFIFLKYNIQVYKKQNRRVQHIP